MPSVIIPSRLVIIVAVVCSYLRVLSIRASIVALEIIAVEFVVDHVVGLMGRINIAVSIPIVSHLVSRTRHDRVIPNIELRHPGGLLPSLVAPVHDDEEDDDGERTHNDEGDGVAVGEVGVRSVRGIVVVVVIVAAVLVAVVGVPINAGPVRITALLWARCGYTVWV